MLLKKRFKNLRYQKKPIYDSSSCKKVHKLNFGRLGLISKNTTRITKKQVEAFRRSLTRVLKKKNKIWIKSRLNYAVTVKPLGLRMGKGKGDISQKIKKIFPGTSIVELSRYKKIQLNSLTRSAKKLPITFKIVWSKW